MAAVQESVRYDDTLVIPNAAPCAGLARHLPIQEGQLLAGRYRVGRLLGSGGMALVFEGEHVELRSPVAIKIIQPEFAADSHILTRFVNEARGVASLTSPHIARVFDAGRFGTGEAYLVMERLKGKDLGKLLKATGPLPINSAVFYLLQACEGLSEAHATGLIHRDLKPEHLFVVESIGASSIVKLLDFGISKRLDGATSDSARLTHPGDSMGSPWYMSPEQMQNPAAVDARTDIWSLGVVMYEVLSGTRPFDGETVGQIQWQVIGEEPVPLRQLRSDVPEGLEHIVERCLKKQPAERFASASELGLALREFLATRGALSDAPAPLVHLKPPPSFDASARREMAAGAEPKVLAPEPSANVPEPNSRRGGVHYAELLAADAALEPTADELFAAGIPRKRSTGLVLATVFLSLVGGACLGLFWLGGLDNLQAWAQGFNPDSKGLSAEPSRPWEPLPLPVKVTSDPSAVGLGLAPTTEPAAEVPAPEPAATPPSLTSPPQVGVPAPADDAPADDRALREGLTPDQIEARYREWLKRENLTPVDEVPLDSAPGNADPSE